MFITLLFIALVISIVLLWRYIIYGFKQHTNDIYNNMDSIKILSKRIAACNNALDNRLKTLERIHKSDYDTIHERLKKHDKDIKDITNSLYSLFYD